METQNIWYSVSQEILDSYDEQNIFNIFTQSKQFIVEKASEYIKEFCDIFVIKSIPKRNLILFDYTNHIHIQKLHNLIIETGKSTEISMFEIISNVLDYHYMLEFCETIMVNERLDTIEDILFEAGFDGYYFEENLEKHIKLFQSALMNIKGFDVLNKKEIDDILFYQS